MALADSLVKDGIQVIFDKYEPSPAQGWPRWMENNLDSADFVLMLCTESYSQRVRGHNEVNKGFGVRWEGNLIYNRIYGDAPGGSRYIPVILEGGDTSHIPAPLRSHTSYQIMRFDFSDKGYESLYRHLTKQPEIVRPSLGTIRPLAPRNLPPVSPVSSDDANHGKQTPSVSSQQPSPLPIKQTSPLPGEPTPPVPSEHVVPSEHIPPFPNEQVASALIKQTPSVPDKQMSSIENTMEGEICIECNDRSVLMGNTAHKLKRKLYGGKLGTTYPLCEIDGMAYQLEWGEATCIKVKTGKAYTICFYIEESILGRRFEVELTTDVVETGKVQSFEYKLSMGFSWSGVVGKARALK